MSPAIGEKTKEALRVFAGRMGMGRPNTAHSAPTNHGLALPVLNLAEFRALDLPERRLLLPWLTEGGLVMIYGPRGIGKTHFGLSLAVALATGQPFLKWEVETGVGVLVVDGEMPAQDLRERIESWLPGEPVATFQVLSHEVVFERLERDLNLGLTKLQNAIMDHFERHPDVRVIILDNHRIAAIHMLVRREPFR